MAPSEQTPKEMAIQTDIVGLPPAEKDTVTAAHGHSALCGWRLRLLTIGLCLCCFLSALDSIIVSTSLTAIAKDLQNFEKSSWVVSSYLTCYFSFMIIWAKVSDFIGRKPMLVTAVIFFLAFSGGCGGAKTMLQLIILRAFQGIGGAGIFSMVPIVTAEMVSPDRYALYNSFISLAIAISFLLGPLIGGAISDSTTWRWIFYINLPVGAIGIVLICLTMPAAFPDVSKPTTLWSAPRSVNLRGKVDYAGFFILLVACILLIVAIEEAGVSFAWDSALVIVFLVLSIVLFGAFVVWEWQLYRTKSTRESVFPWQFVKNRFLMGLCLTALLSGVPFMTLILELPGRFQTLNNDSGLDAGIRILPLTLTIAFGSGLTGGLTARGRVPPFMVFLAAAILQVLGVGLLYSVHPSTTLSARLYGYQVLSGLGIGLSLTTAIMTMPSVVGKHNLSVALGSITQLRILGGAIGVSTATNLLNNTVENHLRTELPPNILENILKDIAVAETLPAHTQTLIRTAFADGYHKQLLMVLGFCAAQLFALSLMWERPFRRLT
ncbi:MFS general substrate transporter [Aspergillus ibericus CBS 121593]|uniref:MFS general substrate transporter n=1 Tax=Aspergillus ibericus CBS 121593 TaxID=1448316 RepID=A0A395GUK2_9EURO|nr:MFS general substrate transporter [Aspergillus ibericus CBS 121593]RAK99185.1 MFS general substrate transporter [Aspergillus ibericus CBS 121593]